MGETINVIKTLTFSTLYPNAAQPAHGIFVENRLRHLLETGLVSTRVVAPVPWVPRALARFAGAKRVLSEVPAEEERLGINVSHPRYPVIPKLGMTVAPALLFGRSIPVLRRLRTLGGGFDLIDAHYFYPDGVAAAMLAKSFRKPVVITARGTDVHLIGKFAAPRAMIKWAAGNAAHVIAVSRALREALLALGVSENKVSVLRNGVDLKMFQPLDRLALRKQMGLSGPILLSVGHLIERKGHELIIKAIPSLPHYTLLICGEGPLEKSLKDLAAELGISPRVRFMGRVPHDQLSRFYAAADALILASNREGWPNVLLEAMACGTPVLATRIGAAPDLVTEPAAGALIPNRTPSGIASAVEQLFANLPERGATREFAEKFSWEETTRGQIEIFQSILEHSKSMTS